MNKLWRWWMRQTIKFDVYCLFRSYGPKFTTTGFILSLGLFKFNFATAYKLTEAMIFPFYLNIALFDRIFNRNSIALFQFNFKVGKFERSFTYGERKYKYVD